MYILYIYIYYNIMYIYICIYKEIERHIFDLNINTISKLGHEHTFSTPPLHAFASMVHVYFQTWVCPEMGNADKKTIFMYPISSCHIIVISAIFQHSCNCILWTLELRKITFGEVQH